MRPSLYACARSDPLLLSLGTTCPIIVGKILDYPVDLQCLLCIRLRSLASLHRA